MDTWEKYWISPKKELITLDIGNYHSYYAKNYYEKQGIEITASDAQFRFLNEGWIRVQVEKGRIALEGLEQSIESNGDLVFDLNPDFDVLVFGFVATGRFKFAPRNMIEGWSWKAIVDEAKKGTIAWGE